METIPEQEPKQNQAQTLADYSKNPGIIPQDVLAMYQISGQSPITPYVVDRYFYDKTRLKQDINNPTSIRPKRKVEKFIKQAEKRDELFHENLEKFLAAPDLETKLDILSINVFLYSLPIEKNLLEKIGQVIEQGLNNPNKDIKLKTIKNLCHYFGYFKFKKRSVSPQLQEETKEFLKEKERELEIKLFLATKDVFLSAEYTLEEKLNLEEILFVTNPTNKSILISLYCNVIVQALRQEDNDIQEKAMQRANNIYEHISEDKAIEIAEIALSIKNVEIQKKAIAMAKNLNYRRLSFPYFSEEKQTKIINLIEKGIDIVQNHLETSDLAIKLEICGLFEIPEIKQKIPNLISQAFESDNEEYILKALEFIYLVPEEERINIIAKALDTHNLKIQRKCVDLKRYVPFEGDEFFLEFTKRGLGHLLIESRLYADTQFRGNKFEKAAFTKTGSETTLLGGSLKNKVIIRHIPLEAFLAWQKLYEDFSFWQENGFDYVPIEPIVDFKMNSQGLMDVASGVLDLSLEGWEDNYSFWRQELKKDMEKIETIKKEIRFTHGHIHRRNFCLRFFRNPDNTVDFSRKPRIYLIDFDQAISP